ncbi:Fibropellin-1, partial [Stylophora pistillata]
LNRDSSDSEGLLLIMMVEETFHRLNITGIISARVEEGDECGFACAANPKCFSYNLEANISLTGTGLCELLPSDKYNNSEKFIKSPRFHHYSIKAPRISLAALKSTRSRDVTVVTPSLSKKQNIDDCKNDSCQNKGTCIDRVNGFDCRCPLRYSGARCELEIDISINSTILSKNTDFLRNLSDFLSCAVGNSSQWLLCHRASMHGWAAATFHTRCDHKKHTVTIIKNGQYVFGGYTDIPWVSTSGSANTSSAFIFSLRNKEELHPFKSRVRRPEYAIYSSSSYGPTFGWGYDIYISDNANSNKNSYTTFASGGYYESPKGVQDLNTILAGTQFFSPDDWEVFYLG